MQRDFMEYTKKSKVVNRINWLEYHKPIILPPDNWNKENDYLLYSELKKCYEMVEKFSSMHKEFKVGLNDSNCINKKFEVPMNIGVVGERGTGKTSLLQSLKLKLEAENYFVFDIIDPNTLSSELNILEILVSNIYSIIQKEATVKDGYLRTKIMSLFKKIMGTLAIKRQKSDFLKKDTPLIDIVEKINDIVRLDDLIIELFDKFIEFRDRIENAESKKTKGFVLIIDDLDLIENHYVLRLISEIQEYLNSKIIVVLGYKSSQIEESILEEKIKNNKVLIDQEIIEVDSLKHQIDNLLIKLIPIPNRVKLYDQAELLNQDYLKVLESLGIDKDDLIANRLIYRDKSAHQDLYEDGNETNDVIDDIIDYNNSKNHKISVEKWAYNRIQYFTKLFIKPVDAKETAHLFLPRSMRELIQLAGLFGKCYTLTDSSEIRIESQILHNVKIFREYFLGISSIELDYEQKKILDSWFVSNSYQKNYLIFHYFLKKFEKSDQERKVNQYKKYYSTSEYPFDLEVVENYNLRLGDIFEIMELYKKYVANSRREFFIIYFFKVLYSLELVELLLEAYLYNTEQEEAPVELSNEYGLTDNVYLLNYQQLINTSFMPDSLNYIDYRRVKTEGDYTFKNEISNRHIEQFVVDTFITSPYATKGDIKTAIKTDLSGYRHKKFYSFNKIGDIYKKISYTIEFFVPFIKTAYVSKALLEYQDKNKNQYKFLFYSMFQIDQLIRQVYSTRGEKYIFYFVIKRIQKIFKELNDKFYEMEEKKEDVEKTMKDTKKVEKTKGELEGIDYIDERMDFEELNRDYFWPILKDDRMNYEIPYKVEDALIKDYLRLDSNIVITPDDEISFYQHLFKELFSEGRTTSDGLKFQILTDGKEFAETIYLPGEQIEIAKQKNSIKNMVSKIKKHKDQLSPQVRSILDDIEIGYLNPDAKTTLANHRIRGLILSLFRQFEKEYGIYKGDGDENLG